MKNQAQGKRMTRQEAEEWRTNWKKSCAEGARLSEKTPPGFLLDRATVERILAQGAELEGLWVSFGQKEPSGELRLILQGYTGEGEPFFHRDAAEDEEEIYDDFGTCCPKKS